MSKRESLGRLLSVAPEPLRGPTAMICAHKYDWLPQDQPQRAVLRALMKDTSKHFARHMRCVKCGDTCIVANGID